MIAPVRPVAKAKFPDLTMQEYLLMKTENQQCYDFWIRTHLKYGAEILNVCSTSLEVRATVSKWREWTSLPLNASGRHHVPEGLVLMNLDLDRNLGIYLEPNIWMQYSL